MYNLMAIESETVTDNILHLMTIKILSLADNIQQALKVASTFGISVNKKLVTCLSNSEKFSSIGQDLQLALSGGYIEEELSGYKFPHDKGNVLASSFYALAILYINPCLSIFVHDHSEGGCIQSDQSN